VDLLFSHKDFPEATSVATKETTIQRRLIEFADRRVAKLIWYLLCVIICCFSLIGVLIGVSHHDVVGC
jgi:hypothetical protein